MLPFCTSSQPLIHPDRLLFRLLLIHHNLKFYLIRNIFNLYESLSLIQENNFKSLLDLMLELFFLKAKNNPILIFPILSHNRKILHILDQVIPQNRLKHKLCVGKFWLDNWNYFSWRNTDLQEDHVSIVNQSRNHWDKLSPF